MKTLFLSVYFFLLGFIAFYGFHLYWLIIMYLRNRRQSRQISRESDLRATITVQLPVYNERMVIVRLIRAVAALDWPPDKLDIQVLDDSDDDTSVLAASEVTRLQQNGFRIVHLRRGGRLGFKAGALQYGLGKASGDYIAIFDADNVPNSDFLKNMMPYFTDPKIGLVQARWSFLNREQSLLCRAQALYLDAHFFIEQAVRSSNGLFMNFNGTAGIWRRKTIESAGGWQPDTLTEDLDLSYRAQLAGWRLIFCEKVDVPTELPNSVRAFKIQQFRWAKGCFETGLKLLPRVFAADVPLRVKVASFFHLTQRTTSIALLILAILLVPALYIRLEGGMWKVFALDLPIFVAGTGSMSIYYGLAYKRGVPDRSWKNTLLLPALTSLGIGLAVNSTHAILSASLRRRSRFVRTPKTGSIGGGQYLLPSEYKIRRDRTVKLEAFLGLYALSAVCCAISLGLYFSVPFLMTFAFGFSYFALQSLREGYE